MAKGRPGYHIPLVDNEASVRQSLAVVFLSKGLTVNTATDGFDALLRLRTMTPDVIASDLNMPNQRRRPSSPGKKRPEGIGISAQQRNVVKASFPGWCPRFDNLAKRG